jgi:hypothetical protein
MKKILSVLLLALFFTGCTELSGLFNDGSQAQNDEVVESDVITEDPDNIEVSDSLPTNNNPSDENGIVLDPVVEEPKDPVVQSATKDTLVTFFPQAPYGVWDELHSEACEEASMIMVDSYFDNTPLALNTMEQAILNSVKWQEQNNYTVDVSARQVVDILKTLYDRDSTLITDVTAKSIKDEIDKGNLVIVPAAGRLLGNPYFSGQGPLYHMLVVRGYDDSKNEFITNDPGTKRGEAYRYSYSTLIHAIHDWPKEGLGQDRVTEAEMNAGRKVFVSVKP